MNVQPEMRHWCVNLTHPSFSEHRGRVGTDYLRTRECTESCEILFSEQGMVDIHIKSPSCFPLYKTCKDKFIENFNMTRVRS